MTRIDLIIHAVCGVIVAGAAGCTGHARITLIPLSSSAIEPDGPLEIRLNPQECYWWVDDDGKLNLAMAYHNLSLLGNYTRDALELSLILGEPASRPERRYSVDRKTARGVWHRGAFHLRLRSRRGAVALRLRDDNILVGRFRLFCMSQSFGVLTGWNSRAQVLVQGQFTAFHDEHHGKPIFERIEKEYPRDGSQEPKGAVFVPG